MSLRKTFTNGKVSPTSKFAEINRSSAVPCLSHVIMTWNLDSP